MIFTEKQKIWFAMFWFCNGKSAKIIFASLCLIGPVLFYFIYTVNYPLYLLRPRPTELSSTKLQDEGEIQITKRHGKYKGVFDQRLNQHEQDNGGKHFRRIDFDPYKNHSLVMLHIQKTGGSNFERRMVEDLVNVSCSCENAPKFQCDCRRKKRDKEVWLICRYTEFGTIKNWPCGVHPGWTELESCIPKLTEKFAGINPTRKFYYFTQLRNPVVRFFSEYLHVKRGATWSSAVHFCNGKHTKQSQLKCFHGEQWMDVSLQDFSNCKKNLAINRQTRMLANLELVGCYDFLATESARKLMLKSAMNNILSMPYFALMEHPSESQFLFEKTFNMKFKKPWALFDQGYASIHMKNLTVKELRLLKKVNDLDVKLYAFAKEIFFKKLKEAKRLFNENPRETIVYKNPKGLESLQRNWKRKSVKFKTKKTKGRGNKKNKHRFYKKRNESST